MNANEELIHKFYTAFANADSTAMCECYHADIQFQDPVFRILKGSDACQMWKMLLEKSKGNIQIQFSDIKADEYSGIAKWTAVYYFSKTKRKVVNEIHAQFQFRDGLLIKHTDYFDIWKWSKQALGFKGFLLGWTRFMQQKIHQQAIASLKNYTKIQSR